MNTLYLTQAEQQTFAALSDTLRNGWQVASERDIPADTPAKMQMRLQLMRLQNQPLKDLAKTIKPDMTKDALQAIFSGTTLKDVSDGDLAELTFAMGPACLTNIIVAMLATADTDVELEQLAALTTLRHQLLS